ncbi:hypothetical protein AOL_s00043g819 [Orbilia oligospora ATCC 24927]|uniref:Beta-lactamase-related domain-containing protein n=1 Tax=Arthrobotrys oligospora (strain ATCC 24927 / CBS 115.81 / DSM 1491) TaxID=756982 RepID=G1X545_ARTOA|nr:hypothetical protein AOL_s00043g819 [Orbilia oligospora ATCC 24927]EGX51800.1 hypothetical protein AOL_s00043g819 [Orbilia oligospora ATCC 24927]
MESRSLVVEFAAKRSPKIEGRKRMKSNLIFNACCTIVGFSVGVLITVYTTKTSALFSESTFLKRQVSENYEGKTILASGNPSAANPKRKCAPPPPQFLLEDPRIMDHDAVKQALAHIDSILKSTLNATKDAVSLSIVHSAKGKGYEFHKGRKRLNESGPLEIINGDSIHRVLSVTKLFTVLEALVLGRQAQVKRFLPELTLESRLQDVLPEFSLGSTFKDAGDITLGELGGHRSGLSREVGKMILTSFNDVTWPPIPGRNVLGHGQIRNDTSIQEYLKMISKRDLVWQVGETPSYSNTGFNLLGLATERYRQRLTKERKRWDEMMKDDIFNPLGMDHTFAGPIPEHLRKDIITPNASNMVDLVLPHVTDPAAGMFSTSNDLSKLLHKVLLSSNPLLISNSQRHTWLKSIHQNTDGMTSVGIPWESYRAMMPDYGTYNIHFKLGSHPAHQNQISVFPEFGYGVVALVSVGSTDEELTKGAAKADPLAMSFDIHNTLAPAIWKAYNSILISDYVGTYTSKDGIDIARIVWENDLLVIKELKIKGVDMLLKADHLLWALGGPQFKVFEGGIKLTGTGYLGNFRGAALNVCAWDNFDIVTTKTGWGVDLFVIKKLNGKMTFLYEPLQGELVKQ